MYEAIVTQLKEITRIDGADRIVSAQANNGSVNLATVIVGIDHVDGDIGIYFPPDVQLSEEYCIANDLIARYDETGKKIGGGLFDHKRRVKAQKLKGIRSEGLWMPLSSLNYTLKPHQTIDNLSLGDKFADYMRSDAVLFPICKKYFNERTLAVKNGKTPKRESKVIHFPEHVDTAQLIHEINTIPTGARITITEKLHGTSHRVGNVLVKKSLKWYQRAINWFGRWISAWPDSSPIYKETGYEIVHGSRRVVLNDVPDNSGYYGTNDFRYKATENIRDIPEGMIIFGEIVGYVGNTPIMNPHSTKDVKELKSQYGASIIYDYGCKVGECKFYIYRITVDDVELSWNDVQIWANKLGYSTPPQLIDFPYNGDESMLMDEVKFHAECDKGFVASKIGNHISEGVVLRIDHNNVTRYMKYKSFAFKVMEGIIKDTNAVDMEEVS